MQLFLLVGWLLVLNFVWELFHVFIIRKALEVDFCWTTIIRTGLLKCLKVLMLKYILERIFVSNSGLERSQHNSFFILFL